MLSHDKNEMMCRVGPGTPMGKAMRHFWVPALMSSELPQPDGDPVAVELLGERLVAFRSSTGQIGLLREHCCHRSASLAVGRVENCGIRCLYHGWLYAPDGRVLETPNVADPNFKNRIKGRAYPVAEAGGIVWAYLGDAANIPPLPDFPFMNAPEHMRLIALPIMQYNYVQVLEGTLDSAHLGILHKSEIQKISNSGTRFAQEFAMCKEDVPPVIESEQTSFGLLYAALRRQGDQVLARLTAFASPFWMIGPHGDIYFAAVPMTDEKTAFFHIWYDGAKPYGAMPLAHEQLSQVGVDNETLEAYGMTRKTQGSPNALRRDNGWRQDREAIRNGHFTGMPTITLEDVIVNISGGPLRDRSLEMLSPADTQIMHLYRALLKLADAAAEGRPPAHPVSSVGHIRGAIGLIEMGADWRTLVPEIRDLHPQVA